MQKHNVDQIHNLFCFRQLKKQLIHSNLVRWLLLNITFRHPNECIFFVFFSECRRRSSREKILLRDVTLTLALTNKQNPFFIYFFFSHCDFLGWIQGATMRQMGRVNKNRKIKSYMTSIGSCFLSHIDPDTCIFKSWNTS